MYTEQDANVTMINHLPKSNIVEAGYLESMLHNFTTSYKFFWFKAIYTELLKGNRIMEYKKIVSRMIAFAWYPVVYYKLNLGQADKLAETIWYIHDSLGVPRETEQEKIVDFVYNCEDKKLVKMAKDFTDMVSYRLIRPFYQQQIQYERKVDLRFNDGKVNGIIEKYNVKDSNAFYIMDKKNGILTVSAKWEQYIRLNKAVIEGWMNYKLIEYIQRRNPNVPAIPFKIFPPQKRDLKEAITYWELVRQYERIPDLYTGEEFTPENTKQYGVMSIDHFIPWSFVLHDELWNLYPMFKNINSSKNNKLPDKEQYLTKFCEYQYRAFVAAKNIPQIKKKTLEQFLTVREDIFQIGMDDRGHDAFITSMKNTIEPLYQIANNQGYAIWSYQ